MLSTKKGKEAYVEPVIEGRELSVHGEGGQAEAGCGGGQAGTTKAGGRGGSFRCLMSNEPIAYNAVRVSATRS